MAKRTGSTVSIVRRIVGKVNPDEAKERRAKQEATAKRIDTEPLTFKEKARKWVAETGQSEVTFWRVLQRGKPS